MIELHPAAGRVLIVGGGEVALRKVRNLAEGGFEVSVIAPTVLPALAALPGVTVALREFADTDIAAAQPAWALVLACTSSRAVNVRVGELSRGRAIPVLVADSQDESTFFTPATLRDGGLQVAVSTGGADPRLARTIRERIARALGTGWDEVVAAARRERQGRLARGEQPPGD